MVAVQMLGIIIASLCLAAGLGKDIPILTLIGFILMPISFLIGLRGGYTPNEPPHAH